MSLATYTAGRAFPNGATLVCDTCEHSVHATTADCGRFLAHGWPKHCGETMRLTPAKASVDGASHPQSSEK